MTTNARSERFVQLLEQHKRILYKVASVYCAHAEDRQDLAQEIVIQLWRAFPRYDDQFKFSTWMYRIGMNVAISFNHGCGVLFEPRRGGIEVRGTLRCRPYGTHYIGDVVDSRRLTPWAKTMSPPTGLSRVAAASF